MTAQSAGGGPGVGHTSGPWSLEDNDNGDWILRGADGANLDLIPQSTYVDGRHDPEQEANAHLIAAAPDLFAALRGMIAQWEVFTKYGSPMAKAANVPLANARAAIARATGAAP